MLIDLDSGALGLDPRAALAGGEDHSLFATFPAGTSLPGGFRAIGVVSAADGRSARVTLDGRELDDATGWDPYARWGGAAG